MSYNKRNLHVLIEEISDFLQRDNKEENLFDQKITENIPQGKKI